MPTIEDIKAALGRVIEPELHQDLISLKMVNDIHLEGNEASLRVTLTTPACPLKARIEKEVREAVLSIPGIDVVTVKMDSRILSDGINRETLSLSIKNAVAIASGKGGVGKSTVAVNTAVSLAQMGAAVGLLDADIYGPNIPTMMGVDSLPAPVKGRLVPAEAFGVKMMSIGFMVKAGQPLIWRGPMLHTAIHQFLADVDWGELDYLIVDLPPGTGDAQLSLMQNLPLSGGIIVTMPQKVSLEDAGRGLQMFREMKVPVIGIIENMSYLMLPDGTKLDLFGMGGGAELAKKMDAPFLGEIPIEAEVRLGGDSGKPIVIYSPESPAALALKGIAERIAAQVSIVAYKKSLAESEEKVQS